MKSKQNSKFDKIQGVSKNTSKYEKRVSLNTLVKLQLVDNKNLTKDKKQKIKDESIFF